MRRTGSADEKVSLYNYTNEPLFGSVLCSADKYLNSLLTILEANPDYAVKEDVPEEDDSDKDRVPENGETVFIQGSIVAFIDRLDDEFAKSLQNIDPHTTDYVDRLKDEVSLYTVIVRSNAYFQRVQLTDSICRTSMRRLEHLYFKVSTIRMMACPYLCVFFF